MNGTNSLLLTAPRSPRIRTLPLTYPPKETRAARHLEELRVRGEVLRAINAWAYSQSNGEPSV